MTSIAFDTLNFAHIIEDAGADRKLAEAIAKAVSTVKVDDDEFAHKTETNRLQAEVTDIKQDILLIKKDIAEMKANMATKADLKDLQIRMGGMFFALGGILIAIRYFG